MIKSYGMEMMDASLVLLEVCCKGLRMRDEERWVDQRGAESWLPWRCNKGDEGGRPSKMKWRAEKHERKMGSGVPMVLKDATRKVVILEWWELWELESFLKRTQGMTLPLSASYNKYKWVLI
jgi:hypothetical protein